MKCCDCGKEMRLLTGYRTEDPNVGLIETDGEYWECTNPDCRTRLVPAATVEKVDAIREDRVNKMLWTLAGDPEGFAEKFICVKDVAAMLGVSRQAVEKSVFVKGMTYNFVVGHVRYWLKESVERYKKTGNGRFPLVGQTADTCLSFKDIAQGDFDGLEEYVSRLTSQPTSVNSTSYIAKRITRKTTGGTCSSRKTSSRPQGRKFSLNRQQHRSLSISSTSQETQKIQYLKYQPATSSTASM